MDEKTIQRIKKLQALAERGVGGEKETAAKMLQRLLEKNGISTLEELEKEEIEYFLFSYNGRHEIKLLKQCMYKVLGYHAKITSGEIIAGKWIKQIYKIIVDALEKQEYFFNAKAANKAIKFEINYICLFDYLFISS